MNEVLIRNQCALERIDPRFVPLVEAARAGMVACCEGRLQELRLQGSIARGDAHVGLADLDMLALMHGSSLEEENCCLRELAARLGAGTDLVSRYDLEAIDANSLEPFRRFVLSSDSVCVQGADSVTIHVQSMERSALARLVTPAPTTMLPDYLAWTEELSNANDAERRFASRIIGKDFLKVLRGVLLLRGAPYQAAIPEIAAQVSSFAPDAVGIAERLFALYSEPTTDVDAIGLGANVAATFLTGCPELDLLHGASDVGLESLDRPTS